MAFCQVSFFSRSLVVASSVYVILPEPNMGIGISASGGAELPQVLYLLHGYSDDHSIWMRRTSVERYAASHNLCVVMPAVNHSFYLNEAHGERYWDYVSEELPETMHQFFRLSDRPEDTYVAGLSMGGYGAMKLALTHPDRFQAAASFSGAVDLAGSYEQPGRFARYQNLFGSVSTIRDTDADLFYLLKQPSARRPKLYVSCGTADGLYPAHLRFCEALKKETWDPEASETEGAGHEWGLWDQEIRTFIEHYVK
ncbi:MAG: esterase family protein [Clostridia bacterium]|nr:esterase family protein [Clostridia bacterium]